MLDEAISAYKKAIIINIDHTKARFNLGLSYLKKGMLDAAISEHKEVISLDPNDADAHFNLGIAYGIKGLDTLEANHLYEAGLIYLKQGDRESALEAYESLKLIKSKEPAQALFEQLHPERQSR